MAIEIAASLAPVLAGAPRFAGWPLADALSQAAGAGSGGPVEVAVVGAADSTDDLVRTAWRHAPAGSVVVRGVPDASGWELLRDRVLVDARPTAYVCRQFVCRLPVTDADDLITQLAPR